MNAMNMPGFTAEASLYRTDEHYYRAVLAGSGLSNQSVTMAFDWPPFLCVWFPFLPGCPPPCVPTTRCSQDPATTDPRCQICYRDNCDGTGSMWHTC